jgi:hypothetical protein
MFVLGCVSPRIFSQVMFQGMSSVDICIAAAAFTKSLVGEYNRCLT